MECQLKPVILGLIKQGLQISVRNDNLSIKGNLSCIDDDTKQFLKTNKQAIIEFIKQRQSAVDHIIQRLPEGTALPLSFAQQRLWFVDKYEGGSSHYNMPIALTLKGLLDSPALSASFTALIERHEVLRTTFVESDNCVYQQIGESTNFKVEFVDLSSLSNSQQEQKCQELVAKCVSTQFDLEKDILLRAILIKLSEQSHVLMINMHHIVSDGWSMPILVDEVVQLYSSFSQKKAHKLPLLPIQYSDFAHWQRQWLDSKEFETALAYWQNYLLDIPLVHSLPLDNLRPARERFEGSSKQLTLDSNLTSHIKQFCHAQDVTPFMLLHLVFAILLSKFSGENDIVIGTPVAGRNNRQVEPLIGMFVNTLALRTNIQAEKTFNQLLQQSRDEILECFEHQNIPFELLVEKINHPRSASHSPIFQISFSFDNNRRAELKLGGLAIETLDIDRDNCKFDLELSAVEEQGELNLLMFYKTALFEDSTIEAMLSCYLTLLSNLLSKPDIAINYVEMGGNSNSPQLVSSSVYEESVVHCFEAQCNFNPESVAIIDGSRTLTYGQLNRKAELLANYLTLVGVSEGDITGIMLPRCSEYIVAIIATLKLGAAYVPLDLEFPEQRLKAIADDCNLNFVLTFSNIQEADVLDNVHLVMLDSEQSFNHQTRAIKPSLTHSSLAYVIFTSGSTGKPKGALVNHLGILRLVRQTNYFEKKTEQRWLFYSSPTFDAATFEIFGSLLNGGTLVVHPQRQVSVKGLERSLSEHKVEVCFMTSALFEQWVNTGPSSKLQLRQLFVGGEVLSPIPVVKMYNINDAIQLINVYGPTENTCFSTIFEIPRGWSEQESIPIGKAINGTSCYVLNDALIPQTQGVIGELYLGGHGVGQGYLNNTQITQKSFIDSPFGVGEKLYKTGDMVRWSIKYPDNIEFIGRRDGQIKLRGFRIELGEIEACLAGLPEVREAYVLIESNNALEKRLQAYVVAADQKNENDGRVFEIALKEQLKRKLPDFMVPSLIVLVDRIPLNKNGKIDHSLLRAIEVEHKSSDQSRPHTREQQQLLEIWQNLLGRKAIGITDNFFDLGGHSLLAHRLTTQIKSQLGVSLELRQVFEHNTIEQLAHLVSQSDMPETVSPVVRCEEDKGYPLSFAQQRLWFFDQLDHGSAQYNMPLLLALNGNLNIDALQQAYSALISRHEALRTRFDNIDGVARQFIDSPTNVAIKLLDISDSNQSDKTIELERLISTDAEALFDLAKSLKIRATLVKTESRKFVLLINIHHIASDGWSISLLVNELSQLYNQIVAGKSDSLPRLDYRYVDYANWQLQLNESKHFEQDLLYWTQTLKGAAQQHNLPLDKPRPIKQSYRGKSVKRILDNEISERISKLCSSKDVTLFMFLHSAFAVLLSRYSMDKDIIVASPVAGRVNHAFEGIVGMFVNTVLIRNQVDSDISFQDLLINCKEAVLQALHHQNLPFEHLVDAISPQRSSSFSPLAQVMLAVQNNEDGLLHMDGVEVSQIEQEATQAKMDLELGVLIDERGLVLNWLYNSDLFKSDSIERMAESFEVLLQNILLSLDQSIASYPIVSADAEQSILELGKPEKSYSHGLCIHNYVEEQASMVGNKTAIVCNDLKISFSQLNNNANRLARMLIDSGVECGAFVAVSADRSIEMITALLAVLKVGGVYVPIEPDAPHERISYIIEDSGTKLLLRASDDFPKLATSLPTIDLLDATELNVLERYDDGNLVQVNLNSQSPAYVIYTSGSTGNPKGVIISHQNVVRLFTSSDSVFKFSREDVWTMFHSFAFDFSVWEIWGALCHGAELVLVPKALTSDTIGFTELLSEKNVTVLSQTPSAFYNLLKVLREEQLPLVLRYVVFGGEALDFGRLTNWFNLKYSGNTQLVNMYGITETTVHVTYKIVTSEDTLSSNSNIGRPLDDLGVYVCNEYMQLQPIGAVGELHVCGGGVAAEGYLNRQQLTNERFIENPFVHGPEKLYKTGDLVRWMPNQELCYIGRNDTQIKIRGYRIEIGEIEYHIGQLPIIEGCVVRVTPSPSGSDFLSGYIVLKSFDFETIDEQYKQLMQDKLVKHLASRIPDYMIPRVYIFLPELPLTVNGKVDLLALPEVTESDFTKSTYQPPETLKEKILVTVWQKVLSLEVVGIHDNFFNLGGDSIFSIQIVSKANERGVIFTLADIFANQTIAELAKVAELGAATETAMLPFELLTEQEKSVIDEDIELLEDAYPLTSLQRGMVFHMLLDKSIYHDVYSYRITLPWKPELFEQALAKIVRIQPILRTCFKLELTRPLQLVKQSISTPLVVEDISYLSDSEQDAYITKWLEQEKSTPFDLTNGPLLRVYVRLRGEQNFDYGLSFHHAVLDGWSMALFSTTLERYYCQLLSGGVLKSEPTNWCFRTFVQQEQQALADQHAKNYWQDLLQKFSGTQLPRTVRSAFNGQDNQQEVLRCEGMSSHSSELILFAQRLGKPLQAILLVLHLKVIRSLSGQRQVQTNFVTSMRPEKNGGERSLGLFLNSVPVVADIDGLSWLEAIDKVSIILSAHMKYRHFPVSSLPQNDNEILFNYTHFREYEAVLTEGNTNLLEDRGIGKTNFDLEVDFSRFDDKTMDLVFTYNRNVFDSKFVERLSSYYTNAAKFLLSKYDENINEVSLLNSHEQDLLSRFEIEDSEQLDMVTIFERQLLCNSQELAVIGLNEQLTYRELNSRANKLASLLLSEGLERGEAVVICAERSVSLVIAIVAVIKAGGCYVPLDKDYPKARALYMLKDCKARFAIGYEFEPDEQLADAVTWFDMSSEGLKLRLEEFSGDNPDITISPEQPIYIIYTSGSTGHPKGVIVTHRNNAAYLQSSIKQYALPKKAKVLGISSVSFDIFVEELALSIFSGGSLYFSPSTLTPSVTEFWRTISRYKIDCVSLPTAYWQMLCRDMTKQQGEVASSVLHSCIVGGEAMKVESLRLWQEKVKGTYLWNTYGPTECTVVATGIEVSEFDSMSISKLPIGVPFEHCQTYVLDEYQNLVPIGGIGELYLGGAAVAKGYVNKPELTESAFILSPFKPDERLYRTGDLVSWQLLEGYDQPQLVFVGRNDEQRKWRGYRIELNEIEQVISGLNEVKTCLVRIAEKGANLVAYLVMKEDSRSETLAQLRRVLKQQLPDYMIPTDFVVLADLPLTVNGKVNYAALPQPLNRIDETRNVTQPQGVLENEIYAVWAEEIGQEHFDREDSFFEIGGHSLAMVTLITKLSNILGVEIGMQEFMQHQSIAALAELVTKKREGKVILPQSVTELSPKVNNRILFLLPAAGVTGAHYQPLAEAAKEKLGISILSNCLPVSETSILGFDRLAAQLADIVKEQQKEGPYYIAGHSFGGILAYEIALNLSEAGESVNVIMLDSILWLDDGQKFGNFSLHEEAINSFTPTVKMQLLRQFGIAIETDTVEQQWQQYVSENAHVKTLISTYCQQMAWYDEYQPSAHFTGRLTLMVAEQSVVGGANLSENLSKYQQWCEQEVEVVEVKGDHMNFIGETYIKDNLPNFYKSLGLD